MIRFLVVDTESAYNVVLGRSSLNEFQAIASIYHMKIKFSAGEQVAEVRGYQQVARNCYQVTVREGRKRRRDRNVRGRKYDRDEEKKRRTKGKGDENKHGEKEAQEKGQEISDEPGAGNP